MRSHIEIYDGIYVFDDSVSCHDGEFECGHLEKSSCKLYREAIQCGFKKCEKCKEAWKKAKALSNVKSLVDNQKDLPDEYAEVADDLFRDKSGKTYIDPMHPERGVHD